MKFAEGITKMAEWQEFSREDLQHPENNVWYVLWQKAMQDLEDVLMASDFDSK